MRLYEHPGEPQPLADSIGSRNVLCLRARLRHHLLLHRLPSNWVVGQEEDDSGCALLSTHNTSNVTIIEPYQLDLFLFLPFKLEVPALGSKHIAENLLHSGQVIILWLLQKTIHISDNESKISQTIYCAAEEAMPPADSTLPITAAGEDPQEQKQLSLALVTLIFAGICGWLLKKMETPLRGVPFLHDFCTALVILLFFLSLVLLAKLSFSAANASGETILGCSILYIHVAIYVCAFAVFVLKLSDQPPFASFLLSSLMFVTLLLGVLAGPHLPKLIRYPGFFGFCNEHCRRVWIATSDLV